MNIILKPVAIVRNSKKEPSEDYWGSVQSEIILEPEFDEDAFDGIESFSHLNIIFHMDRAKGRITGSEHPRENPDWPKVGIFAQRKKDRPNHIGLTVVELIKRDGRKLIVSNLDALDGTPILDIKPVFKEFLPKRNVKQPSWSEELMKNYW